MGPAQAQVASVKPLGRQDNRPVLSPLPDRQATLAKLQGPALPIGVLSPEVADRQRANGENAGHQEE
jgi:hypothetical protein